MTPEEQKKFEELKLFGEQLDARIKRLENKPEIKEEKKFDDIKFFPLLKVDTLYYKTLNPAVTSLTYTMVDHAEHNTAGILDFEDYDISAIVPVGTKYVDVLLHNTEAAVKTAKTRANGDTTITTVFAIAAGLEMIETCPVDTNRIIEIKANSTSFGFRIVGYWL